MSTSTAPYTEFGFAPQSTILRPRVLTIEPMSIPQAGHHRSIPKGMDSPAPSKRVQPSKTREMPHDMTTSGVTGAPATEPENAPILQPVSRL